MDADTKTTSSEPDSIECIPPATPGKEDQVEESVGPVRSVPLRNDQISENDLQVLAEKAKEMIGTGIIPPTPVLRVREGKRLRKQKGKPTT